MAKALVKMIYKLTKDYPDSESYNLISQLKRSSISISSDIGEGSSSTTNKDQAKFHTPGYSSLTELLNQAIISEELGSLDKDSLSNMRIV